MFKSKKYQQGHRLKIRIPGTAPKIIISAAVLLVILLVAGTIYTLISGNDVKPPPAPVPSKTADATRVLKPPQPGANAPEGVALVSITSPVKAGENSSIAISTNAGSTCMITVTYNNVASKDSGLIAKKADDYGNIEWTWTVDSSAPVGTWPVKVTCVYHGRSGVLVADLKVTK